MDHAKRQPWVNPLERVYAHKRVASRLVFPVVNDKRIFSNVWFPLFQWHKIPNLCSMVSSRWVPTDGATVPLTLGAARREAWFETTRVQSCFHSDGLVPNNVSILVFIGQSVVK